MGATAPDQAALVTPRQPTDAAQPDLWGAFALMTALVTAALLPWDRAVVALVAFGPVLAIMRADLHARVVPDLWVAGLAGLALLVTLWPSEAGWADVGAIVARAAVIVAIAMGISRLAGLSLGGIPSRDALGRGDLAVIGVSALWLPVSCWLLAVLMSCLAALLVTVSRPSLRSAGVRAEIPYAAFLAFATYAVGLMTSVDAVGGWTCFHPGD